MKYPRSPSDLSCMCPHNVHDAVCVVDQHKDTSNLSIFRTSEREKSKVQVECQATARETSSALSSIEHLQTVELRGKRASIAAWRDDMLAVGYFSGSIEIMSIDPRRWKKDRGADKIDFSSTHQISATDDGRGPGRIHQLSLGRVKSDWFLTSVAQGGLKTWNLTNPKDPIGLCRIPDFHIRCCEVKMREERILVGGAKGRMSIVDTRLMRSEETLERVPSSLAFDLMNAHSSSVNCIQQSPLDDNLMATGGGDGVVKVWDLRMLRAPAFHLAWHTSSVTSISWSKSHGEMLASGGEDGSVRLWSLNLPPHCRLCALDSKLLSSEIVGCHLSNVSPFEVMFAAAEGQLGIARPPPRLMSSLSPKKAMVRTMTGRMKNPSSVLESFDKLEDELGKLCSKVYQRDFEAAGGQVDAMIERMAPLREYDLFVELLREVLPEHVSQQYFSSMMAVLRQFFSRKDSDPNKPLCADLLERLSKSIASRENFLFEEEELEKEQEEGRAGGGGRGTSYSFEKDLIPKKIFPKIGSPMPIALSSKLCRLLLEYRALALCEHQHGELLSRTCLLIAGHFALVVQQVSDWSQKGSGRSRKVDSAWEEEGKWLDPIVRCLYAHDKVRTFELIRDLLLLLLFGGLKKVPRGLRGAMLQALRPSVMEGREFRTRLRSFEDGEKIEACSVGPSDPFVASEDETSVQMVEQEEEEEEESKVFLVSSVLEDILALARLERLWEEERLADAVNDVSRISMRADSVWWITEKQAAEIVGCVPAFHGGNLSAVVLWRRMESLAVLGEVQELVVEGSAILMSRHCSSSFKQAVGEELLVRIGCSVLRRKVIEWTSVNMERPWEYHKVQDGVLTCAGAATCAHWRVLPLPLAQELEEGIEKLSVSLTNAMQLLTMRGKDAKYTKEASSFCVQLRKSIAGMQSSCNHSVCGRSAGNKERLKVLMAAIEKFT
ncbi:hypothetical protein GUITHDRAFT_106610 [Guillardia theta CCMP2712]|uniref:Uncharacterized protein n=1 Tax=Guillardia theta (strain CCMP2712) TaxID=905079 RepID=L1JH06_GUITC|nr:hypothetical protein GUITHDRAFT_106610 [Guillardia theta CCMP2712]EKX47622.1 hypothetical protein GUITHDRAFT_106610 [Guillardia theta CCMP2712]|eukprot:XP_005834602.1 hypothetical protein GUITHDRAFT_106610 [Guillardia theta CCMP2712]